MRLRNWPVAALMLLLAPGQAYAQLWQGPCGSLSAPGFQEIRADLFGAWAANVSVTARESACRYRGESVWILLELDHASLRGERRLAVEDVRPRGCAASFDNRLEVDVETERDGETCTVRVTVDSFYPGGRTVRGEITRLTADAFTLVTAETASSTVYRRRAWTRPRPDQLARYPEALAWDQSCHAQGDRYFHYISTSPYEHLAAAPQIYRQGGTFPIRPMVQQNGPGGAHQLPGACTADWSISDPQLATLSPDRKSLRIAGNAPPGSEFTLSYRVGERRVAHRFQVVAAHAIVLTGTRSQQGIERCEGLDSIGELVFTPDGRFSVTYRPFETRVDYAGTYRFDPETGALVLSLGRDAGNLDLEGRASLEGGRLILDGFFLGGGFPPPANGAEGGRSCRYIF